MARQDVKTRFVTQISQVSGSVEELYFYPELDAYGLRNYVDQLREFCHALASYVMTRAAVEQGMPNIEDLEAEEFPAKPEAGMPAGLSGDLADQEAMVGRSLTGGVEINA